MATFSTEKAKSCILTAARGYRSEEYPDGIDVDEALYLASLVPQERGQLWTIEEVMKGNPEKGRQPVKLFINEISKYPGLLDIITGIEGLVSSRSSHASGVVFFDKDPCEFGAFMKTPKGDVITQFDLHASEKLGMTKFDFLLTDVQDTIVETIHLLQKDNLIDPKLTLREVYNKYLHPDVLPLQDKKLWDSVNSGKILNFFQFDSPVGAEAIKKIHPQDIGELSSVNGLMRLMSSEKSQETPMEKYVRFKKVPGSWENEMNRFGLTKKEQEVFKRHIGNTYGIGISQEQLMRGLMDPDICNFSLGDANMARKVIAKKRMDQIPTLQEKVRQSAINERVGNYAWHALAVPQLG